MGFSNGEIQSVWEKGEIVSDYNSAVWRKDECGAWINRTGYGNRDSSYGWEIDHISPGGNESLSNLRPLQWQNNLDKSDGRLKCKVVAQGNKNKVRE